MLLKVTWLVSISLRSKYKTHEISQHMLFATASERVPWDLAVAEWGVGSLI